MQMCMLRPLTFLTAPPDENACNGFHHSLGKSKASRQQQSETSSRQVAVPNNPHSHLALGPIHIVHIRAQRPLLGPVGLGRPPEPYASRCTHLLCCFVVVRGFSRVKCSDGALFRCCVGTHLLGFVFSHRGSFDFMHVKRNTASGKGLEASR